jgi:hypothetical protein
MTNPTKGTLRVWHIPQVPGPAFHVAVKDAIEAQKMLDVLAKYDKFQFENQVKPDYSNAQGLEEFDGNEWSEWECDKCGQDIESCDGSGRCQG